MSDADPRLNKTTADPGHTGTPEILIMVRQVIGGQMIQTIKQIDLNIWRQARVSMADRVIEEGLAELDAARRAGPKGKLP